MSIIGAISTTPPTAAAQAVQVQPKQDKGSDEATESNAAKTAEAASPHKVDIHA
jgi:hypothetical protein